MSTTPIPTDAAPAPFASYRPDGGWDECADPATGLRAAWRPAAGSFDRLGYDGIAQRWREGQRLLRDNGVTYNIVGEGDSERPWRLDGIPALLPQSEWVSIERGVVQRAELLEALLADCYGDRILLREGDVPPAAVFAHPGFLRPCINVPPPGGSYLHLLAMDLLRTPTGEWIVTNHRTQAPTGFGYALENRVVVSRSFPGAYRDAGVLRLAGFFRDLLQQLRSLAPRHRDNPRIVLLTPEPPHPGSFENAYLARYLNLPLVRGEDLTARDDGVYLKTLGGLEPVDVVLRRCDDHRSDPLELDSDGVDGTAGLLHAARRGQVAVVNAFGSALAENAAWLPRLPTLCQRILGEDLALQSVATYWGPDELDHVEADIEHLVIKRAFGVGQHSPINGATLDAAGREAIIARLREHPLDYVAQAALQPSTSPTWIDGALVSRPMVLRTYAVRVGDRWQVMPGGLVRVSTGEDPGAFAMARGGVAKDLWVIADGQVSPVSLLPPSTDVLELKRATNDIPSRVADNLFWLGRYAERAENTVRLLRQLVQARDTDGSAATMEAAVLAMRPGLKGKIEDWSLLLTDAAMPDSLPRLLEELQRTALAARDRLSNDTWRLINQLSEDPITDTSDPLPALESALTELSALAGMAMENSVRGPGWRFMDLGRRIERGEFLCIVIPAVLGADSGGVGLTAILELADSMITYRARYLTVLQEPAAIDLVVTDDTNPRSLRFQIEAIATSVAALPDAAVMPLATPPERIATRLASDMRLADPYQLCADGGGSLRALLEVSYEGLSELSQELAVRYLSHTATSRHLGRFGGGH